MADHGAEVRRSMAVKKGIAVLRKILERMRWDDQGGYPSYYGAGRWGFVSTGLPQTTPEELNALFLMAGIEPDVIEPKGTCVDCVHGPRDRGWALPCVNCRKPKMSNFKARKP